MYAIILRITAFLIVLPLHWLWADDPGEDFGQIGQLTTANGDRFTKVEIIQVDPNGLIFRHSRGMAKIVFEDLSPALRERFGYNPESAAEFTKPPEPKPKPVVRAGRRNVRTIVVLQPPRPAPICQPISIPVCWGNFPRYPHSLAFAPYRSPVELDFLYTTGIFPRPPGVHVHRIW